MRTRIAALGTFSTSCRWSVTTRTLAVMPGSKRLPVLVKPTTATYVTTLATVSAAFRTWRTSPSKVWPGNASTVKLAFCPLRIRPTSLSSMLASTCMSDKFCAITNSSGDCKLEATVWPFSIARLITMPSTGEVILVRDKSMRACAKAASRCCTLACALLICACVTPSCACAALTDSLLELTSARALSATLWATNCLSASDCWRSKSRCDSIWSTFARDTAALLAAMLACAVSTAAREASRSACAWRTRYSSVSGSISAINCPAFTSELKSTKMSLICPLTCVPTDTCLTGFTAPLADTVACKLPRSILAVR